MKILVPLAVAATLVACGKTEQTGTAPTSSSTETVESLAANPERLKALREQCSDCCRFARNFHFLTPYAAMRPRLRRFSLVRPCAKSCFFLDISSDNGL
jgi:hypothetical protein